MQIKDIENLSELAKLNLNEEEKKDLLKDIDSILNYIKIIEDVDIKDDDVVYDNINVFREDEEIDCDFDKELILEEFPEKEGRFLKVKKIL